MSSNSDTELLTEHFGYPPVSLIDDIINSVNILAERALNSVEQGLLNAPPAALGFKPPKQPQKKQQQKDAAIQPPDPAEAAKNEVESGTHQLETLLCASIDRNFDKFEIYVLRNILCVRPAAARDWIRLSHYEGLDFSNLPPTAAAATENGGGEDGNTNGTDASANHVAPGGSGGGNPDAPTLEGLGQLRRKLRESMRLNALLTAERARNERLLEDLRRIVGDPSSAATKSEGAAPPATAADVAMANGENSNSSDDAKHQPDKSPFAFLHRKGDLTDAGPDTPISTTTAFTLSQMQSLRALSTSLRAVAPDLAAAKAASRRSRSKSQRQTGEEEDNATKSEEGEGEEGKTQKKSWRRERVEYVESATQRHLETVQGLELGRDGEVRDGEWQGDGRSLARGEVEGLERVVASLVADGGGSNGEAAAGPAGPRSDDPNHSNHGDAREGSEENADRMDET